jgi:uncharacterized metal-binding protein
MSANCAGACAGGPKLIFACSGAADVGAISDLAARKLTKEGGAKMYCLAGVGGRVPGILAATAAASKILAIDGCPLNCVSETLKGAGFEKFEHLLVTNLGLEKGRSEPTDLNVATVAAKGRELLAG